MLGKRIINTGGGDACTTDTTQILNAGTTETLALYRFEDNAFDTSNSTGYINKGAAFNGSNSKINLTAGSFQYTSAFSIAAWIKLSSSKSSHIILENYEYLSSTSRGFAFRIMTGDKLKFDGYYSDATRTDARSNESIPLGVWTHVAAVWNYSNSSIKLYINGSEVTYHTQTFNGMQYHSNCAVNIGALTYGGGAGGTAEQFFHGNIDELRVYDDALTATEIGYIANNTIASIPTGNLVALYSFEGNANDSTSYPINGTASNVIYDYSGTASNVTYATGKFGKAGVFNGSSSRMDLPTGGLGIGTNNFSVSLWFNSADITQNDQGLFWFQHYQGLIRTGAGLSQAAYGGDGDIRFYCMVGGASFNANTNSDILSSNTWYHAVFVKSSTSGMTIYINGSSVATNTSATGAVNTNMTSGGTNTIGAYQTSSTSNYFNGKIDQFRTFNKVLSAGEINSLYNETTTTAALSTISNPSTVAYYKMADATDETGSYNGTASNVDFNVAGKYGFAGKFSGSSGSYMQTGYTAILGTSASISLWVNIDAYTSYGGFAIDSTGTGAQARFTLGQGNTAGKLWVSVGDGSTSWYDETTVSISSYGLNNWFHLVGTVNGTSVKIYINGSLIHTFTSSVSYVGGGQHPYYLGGWGNSLHLNGKLDQIRFFNKAISAAEVTTLYNEVQCANTITTPESYFDTKLYTGTGNSGLQVTGLSFQPDFTWIKVRNSSSWNHLLIDSVRGFASDGDAKIVSSNSDEVEFERASISSFNSNGFTLGDYGGSNESSSYNYVSWNWKAASSNTTNNDGTVASTVRASQESGFSIVQHTAPASGYYTVGHGLNKKPSLVLTKSAGAAGYNWYSWASVLSDEAKSYLALDLTMGDGVGNNYNMWAASGSGFTSTTFGHRIGYSAAANSVQIAYCFANVDGYQRIGSYIGNGSNNGPFIYTGFEPAWIIIKNTDTAYRWYMLDNKRDTTNPNNARLFANDSTAEATNSNIINFHTNGFEIITSDAEVNKSGDKMLFMAIAANPDTTAPTKANSFKTVLYNGTGAFQTITGAGFKPDLAWIKSRSNGTSHEWHDSVRGEPSRISSDLTSAAATSLNGFVSLASDGFTVDGTGGGGEVNTSGRTYAAWLWKALDHDRNLATINNDGANNTIVSVNEEAGFGIVKGSVATSGYTAGLGHGFEVKPEFIIYKPLLSGHHWWAFAEYGGSLLGTNNVIKFSDVTVASSDSLFTITDKTFKTGATSTAHNFIAYCWRSVAGYSRIGTYTGASGSKRVYNTSDGTSTGSGGFTPSFIIIRNRGVAGAWMIYDSVRSSDPLNKTLMVNYASAEQTQSSATINLHSDGFTINGNVGASNSNGNSYFYMAFK